MSIATKIIISLITALTSLAACSKQETYICQCYGGITGGATEKVEIKSSSRDNASGQCAALADPPTNSRNSCELQ